MAGFSGCFVIVLFLGEYGERFLDYSPFFSFWFFSLISFYLRDLFQPSFFLH